MIYLDHAATSWPKPPSVLAAMTEYLTAAGGNPGRSGHRASIAAGRIVYDVREALAEFFGVLDPMRVLFTSNGTHALNLAITGLLRPGQRVVTGGMEHNSVMRPLRHLEPQGVQLAVVPATTEGAVRAADVAPVLAGGAAVVILNHASNVTGTLAELDAICALAHAAGALVVVDAAQSAGAVPIDLRASGIDLLAFTGHKGLLGPPGTGGLVLADHFDPARLQPLLRGGTGSASEREFQPDELPDRFESGTPNGAGLAGLGAGLAWLRERGLEAVRAHELRLVRRLRERLSEVPGVRLYGPSEPEAAVAVVSFTLAGRSVADIGRILDEEDGVLCRVGLHCAPAAHRSIGSFPAGTVRMAPGPFVTLEEIDAVAEAVARIAAR